MDTPTFDNFLADLRRLDNTAAAEVFQRFQRRLIGLARQRLEGRTRGKLDPEDVVQSVFQTVFRRIGEGEFQIQNWESLWGLLTCVTLRKCGKWQDHFHAGMRDIAQEVAVGEDSAASNVWQCIDREPAPEEAAMLAETIEEMLSGLDVQKRLIVNLCLEGRDVAEVCKIVGCTQTKAYRVLRHIRDRLERDS